MMEKLRNTFDSAFSSASSSPTTYSRLEHYHDDVELKISSEDGREHHTQHGRATAPFNVRQIFSSPRRIVLLSAASFILIVFLVGASKPTYRQEVTKYLAPESSNRPAAGLHILIPANEVNTNVCKGVLSAILLGYPAPVLINYNATWNASYHVRYGNGGSHIAKITGISRYIRNLPAGSDQDLLVMLDGHDAWFQLRPDVLLSRYHDITRRADDRLRQQFGPYATAAGRRTQRVLFSTQKTCSPLRGGSSGCVVVPPSILPDGVYGTKTDAYGQGPSDNPSAFFRDRFMNSGAAAGKPLDMVEAFDRAANYSTMKEHDHDGSDQGLFADVWAEQEIMRNRAYAVASGRKEKDVPYYDSFSPKPELNYEMGIGIDYEALLVFATNNHNGEHGWIRYGDVDGIAALSKGLGMPMPRVGPLPIEIAQSTPPFAQIADVVDEEVAAQGWEDVPLFTNIRTGFAPVVVHHNEWRDHAKSRINTTWADMWFQPYAKAMFEQVVARPGGMWSKTRLQPRREEMIVQTGEAYSWMPSPGLIRTDLPEQPELRFEDVCGSAYDVLYKSQWDERELEMMEMEADAVADS